MKIFTLCLTYFNRAIFSLLSISNPVIITLKYFLIFGNISVSLGDLILVSGLSSAPYIFTKLVRALVGYWRGLDRRVFMFLDDGIGGAPDFIAC